MQKERRRAEIPVGGQIEFAEILAGLRISPDGATKEQRVYFLVVGKSGPSLKEALAADDQGVEQIRGDRLPVQVVQGGITGHSMYMGTLAASLAHVAGYQVVEHTG